MAGVARVIPAKPRIVSGVLAIVELDPENETVG
jgi:hypothetical protein